MNTVTGERQDSAPPEFRGGLLADQMGLGKSLTMISLIAANPASIQSVDFSSQESSSCSALRRVKTTLLVLPLPREYSLTFEPFTTAKESVVLKTWNAQLSRSGSKSLWLNAD